VDESMAVPPFREVCAAMLRMGVPVRFRAPGISMRPVIEDGDVLVVEPIEAGAIRRGQVIVAAGSSGLRAHRVVNGSDAGRPSSCVFLRGDALAECDEPVPPERVLGRVLYAERAGRSFRVDGLAVLGKVAAYRLARKWLVPLRRSGAGGGTHGRMMGLEAVPAGGTISINGSAGALALPESEPRQRKLEVES